VVKAAYARWGGGIEAVEFRDAALPAPGPGEALVRLTAATLNYRDLLFIKGLLQAGVKEPDFVPLSCAAGEVVAVGPDASGIRPGERVSPTFIQNAPRDSRTGRDNLGSSVDGVARTHAVFPVASLCKLPDELGDLEAATLPCAGITAWSALFRPRPLSAGEWVAVQGTGGVSLAALQFAKAAGANVVVTSSSDAKLKRAKALGADVCVNYRTTPDWAAAARAALGGRGVDILVDVAGANQLAASVGLLNEGGIVTAVGMLDGDFSWNHMDGRPIAPIAVGSADDHAAMLAFAAAHRLRPVVDVVYDLDRLQDALRHLESGAFFGKVGVNLS
jgi:NADPH:quinone reductase-like Zn-dependent oxidoreductase